MVRSILVPLDGSERAKRALPYAAALGRRSAGRLLLLRHSETSRSVPSRRFRPSLPVISGRARGPLWITPRPVVDNRPGGVENVGGVGITPGQVRRRLVTSPQYSTSNARVIPTAGHVIHSPVVTCP
ncbi:MAG: universal stress protein [Chloroflexota bacterium]|nr:universal stress protein [Chloroflexota bacterium]